MNNLLIIDKDSDLRKTVSNFFKKNGYAIEEATDFNNASKMIKKNAFDVIISDTGMSEHTLYDLLEFSKDKNSMIIISAERNRIKNAIQAIRDGAVDYIRKPINVSELEIKIEKAIELKRLRQEADSLRGERNIIYKTENFIGESPEIKKVFELVRKVAKSNSSVLLTGETGTGKELIAGAIHYNSSRAERAFVKVNCAALPVHLLESELFGHERGAFTSAEKQRIGRFEQADGGTIFLDEIGDMSLTTQSKLLRVLQEKEFQRLGSNRTIKVDVRLISATNKDLIHEIEKKRFRVDLFYRLNVVTITMPPLRHRRGDIILLTYFLLKKYCHDLNKKIKEIHPLAIKQLTEYSWPGNIRELENTIERAVLMADGDTITPEDLHLPYQMDIFKYDYSTIKIPPAGIDLEEVEKGLILQALKLCDWTQQDAAKLLKISKRVLNYKIKRFGITHPKWKKNK
ncbi:MAG: sigma-54-dependent Fis family transcriptional regulator [Spirochaetota bacterium]|nr:MAG: sigma-54-dependent Fis family transcriptional regulator [Spirochaetota bacterium]